MDFFQVTAVRLQRKAEFHCHISWLKCPKSRAESFFKAVATEDERESKDQLKSNSPGVVAGEVRRRFEETLEMFLLLYLFGGSSWGMKHAIKSLTLTKF